MKNISATDIERMEQLMPVIRECLEAGLGVRFYPRGISMLPILRQDIDSVWIEPIRTPLKKYDLPLYRRDDGKYILHRIVAVGETYICIGDNQFQLETGVRPDQLIAVVTAFYRGDKRIPVTDVGYRLYCAIWHHSRPLRHFWRRGKSWLRRRLRQLKR